MSVQINIKGTIIDFPSSAQSPNWAPALIEFAQNVEAALDGIVGPYDISPQIMDLPLTAVNQNVASLTTSLQFPTANVQAALIRYSVFRTNTLSPSTETHAESGAITVVYNPNAPINQKWEIQRDFTGNITPAGTFLAPTTGIFFAIDDSGQVKYSVATIGAPGYTGKLSFAAQALLQTS